MVLDPHPKQTPEEIARDTAAANYRTALDNARAALAVAILELGSARSLAPNATAGRHLSIAITEAENADLRLRSVIQSF